ncbi:MAG: DUF1801 domain-containing protein [Phototrophicaceae bacterium]
MINQKIHNPNVQNTVDSYPEAIQEKLMLVRQLILDIAHENDMIGTIEETLKWGQISYLTHKPKSGTTIRIDEYQNDPSSIALFVHCQTTLIETFQQMYPDTFDYEGTRALIINDFNTDTIDILKHFIELALTYHQRKMYSQ